MKMLLPTAVAILKLALFVAVSESASSSGSTSIKPATIPPIEEKPSKEQFAQSIVSGAAAAVGQKQTGGVPPPTVETRSKNQSTEASMNGAATGGDQQQTESGCVSPSDEREVLGEFMNKDDEIPHLPMVPPIGGHLSKNQPTEASVSEAAVGASSHEQLEPAVGGHNSGKTSPSEIVEERSGTEISSESRSCQFTEPFDFQSFFQRREKEMAEFKESGKYDSIIGISGNPIDEDAGPRVIVQELELFAALEGKNLEEESIMIDDAHKITFEVRSFRTMIKEKMEDTRYEVAYLTHASYKLLCEKKKKIFWRRTAKILSDRSIFVLAKLEGVIIGIAKSVVLNDNSALKLDIFIDGLFVEPEFDCFPVYDHLVGALIRASKDHVKVIKTFTGKLDSSQKELETYEKLMDYVNRLHFQFVCDANHVRRDKYYYDYQKDPV